MLLTQTSNLLSDNVDLLPNQNIRVKCFYDKAKRIKEANSAIWRDPFILKT